MLQMTHLLDDITVTHSELAFLYYLHIIWEWGWVGGSDYWTAVEMMTCDC